MIIKQTAVSSRQNDSGGASAAILSSSTTADEYGSSYIHLDNLKNHYGNETLQLKFKKFINRKFII